MTLYNMSESIKKGEIVLNQPNINTCDIYYNVILDKILVMFIIFSILALIQIIYKMITIKSYSPSQFLFYIQNIFILFLATYLSNNYMLFVFIFAYILLFMYSATMFLYDINVKMEEREKKENEEKT